MIHSINDIKDKIKLQGRCAFYDKKLCIDWVGAGFEINFTGDFIRIFFETKAGSNPVYVYSETDGIGHKTAISNSNEVLIADNLEYGVHNFKIMRITEVFSSADNIEDYLNITAVEVDNDCEFMPFEKQIKPIIDFYGDSITNAWASLADPDDEKRLGCDNDYTVSYAYLTAKALNAEARVCAVSGHGVKVTCDGKKDEPMKMFYNMKCRSVPVKMDFLPQPDIAVIALGTNDAAGGANELEFKQAANEFVKLVRNDAPNAKIIWVYGMMNDKFMPVLRKLINDLNEFDNNIYFLSIDRGKRENNETGAFGHPSKKGQLRISKELVKFIKTLCK